MTVYMCEDSFEGILSGIYDARMGGKPPLDVRLETTGQGMNMELFCDYVPVPADAPKAKRVAGAVTSRISWAAGEAIYKAAHSCESEKADCIFRFLAQGFERGAGVIHMLNLPEVFRMFQICRNFDHELHRQQEFLRFSQMEEGILVSRIGPKNDVLEFAAPYFADRLPAENWIIYDENRKKAAMHPAGRPWFMMELDSEWKEALHQAEEEDEYRVLWKALRRSITIKERWNPECQRNLMPLWYRAYMPEFNQNLKDSKEGDQYGK